MFWTIFRALPAPESIWLYSSGYLVKKFRRPNLAYIHKASTVMCHYMQLQKSLKSTSHFSQTLWKSMLAARPLLRLSRQRQPSITSWLLKPWKRLFAAAGYFLCAPDVATGGSRDRIHQTCMILSGSTFLAMFVLYSFE
jgi:hypothetical protein